MFFESCPKVHPSFSQLTGSQLSWIQAPFPLVRCNARAGQVDSFRNRRGPERKSVGSLKFECRNYAHF